MLCIFRSPINKSMYFVCKVDENENPIEQVTEELSFELASKFVEENQS